jgi:hypothetical protein
MPAETIRVQLKLRETQDKEYVPESDVTGVLLPSGWYIVFFNDALPRELEDTVLEPLAKDAEIMTFIVEDASMVSVARGYAKGRRIWEAVHDSSKGRKHLEVSGEPPEGLPTIRDRLLSEAEAQGHSADYLFDVPAELSKAVTGFRHDEDIEGIEGDAFSVLIRI